MTEQQVAYALLYFVLGMVAPPILRFLRHPKRVDFTFQTSTIGRTWSVDGAPLEPSPLTDELQNAYIDWLGNQPVGSTSLRLHNQLLHRRKQKRLELERRLNAAAPSEGA